MKIEKRYNELTASEKKEALKLQTSNYSRLDGVQISENQMDNVLSEINPIFAYNPSNTVDYGRWCYSLKNSDNFQKPDPTFEKIMKNFYFFSGAS